MLRRILDHIFARRSPSEPAADVARRLAEEAHALYLSGDEDGAIERLRAAIQTDPGARPARVNLAQLHYSRLELAAAAEQLDAALTHGPEDGELRLLRAGALLSLGDYARGFADYEHRWERVAVVARRFIFERPRWDGREALSGRRLLVHAEQGFGDTLLFVRYVPLMVEQGAHVIVQCQGELVRLARSLPGVVGVYGKDETLPPFDLQIPMGSLPLALGTTLASVPSAVPYLVADSAERARWRGRLDSAGLYVGLAWKSNAAASDARAKSLTLEALAPVLAVEGPRFVSLQLEGREEAAATRIVDWTAELGDFAATAALVAELDLVITIDSAVAHLAGALGRPAWVLLPYLPDWRWLTQGARTPWYPTARLFRQTRRGDWSPVIGEAAAELARTAAAPAPARAL